MPYHCYGMCDPEAEPLHCSVLGFEQCGGCHNYQSGLEPPHYPVPALIMKVVYIPRNLTFKSCWAIFQLSPITKENTDCVWYYYTRD